MDDTSKSVYLTGGVVNGGNGEWFAFPNKDKNGGKCQGSVLRLLPDGCVNLNSHFRRRRIRCVRVEPGEHDRATIIENTKGLIALLIAFYNSTS